MCSSTELLRRAINFLPNQSHFKWHYVPFAVSVETKEKWKGTPHACLELFCWSSHHCALFPYHAKYRIHQTLYTCRDIVPDGKAYFTSPMWLLFLTGTTGRAADCLGSHGCSHNEDLLLQELEEIFKWFPGHTRIRCSPMWPLHQTMVQSLKVFATVLISKHACWKMIVKNM